jgi:hypothetical protein
MLGEGVFEMVTQCPLLCGGWIIIVIRFWFFLAMICYRGFRTRRGWQRGWPSWCNLCY